MKPVDDKPVWSIVSFVVPAEFRHQGVATALLQGAIAYARKRGATLLEAYWWTRPHEVWTIGYGKEHSRCMTRRLSWRWRGGVPNDRLFVFSWVSSEHA